jgi:RND superfamily putative drug exporter
MFRMLGSFAVRRRRAVLVATVGFALIAAVVGSGAFSALRSGGFDDPGAPSSRAEDLLEEQFGQGQPNLVLLVTATGGRVDAADAQRAGAELTSRLAAMDGVSQSTSYWSLGSPPPLRNDAGDKALVLARVAGDEDQVRDRVEAIADAFAGPLGPVEVGVGGQEQAFAEIGHRVESDLGRAEAIAVPLTLILLVVVFGSLVAAGLPLLVGGVAVVGTFLSLFVIAQVTSVSVFSINLTTALGLGLAIDYSLFVVSRFREELAAGRSVADAVVTTVDTAGRTVAFSALTVAVSLAALLVFPLYFLRSFAYAGIAVVVIAAVTSIVSLPALLATLGHRVDAGRLWRRRPAAAGEHGFWHRVATAVMRRPLPIALGVIAVLLFLGAPFTGARFGLPDDRVLPASADIRQVSDTIRDEFSSHEGDAFAVVAPEAVMGDDASTAALADYAAALSALPGVGRVDTVAGRYAGGAQVAGADASSARVQALDGGAGTWLSIVPTVEPISGDGERLAKAVRAVSPPAALGDVVVGGSSASLVDTKAAIAQQLPWAALLIAATTFVLLFMMTGSLLVPLKAVVLNLLSLSATFGAMVWVFQEGKGADLLGFTATGTLDVTTPVLMFCIAFGLSMDYEVFLLSRIKEEHDRTGDNVASVALGLERTGRIVSAAAALLAVTFLAFASSGVTFLKLFGLGLALAVVMDATVVRGLLVPAFMRLAGEANWWAPAPLRRWHARHGFHEGPATATGDADDEGDPDDRDRDRDRDRDGRGEGGPGQGGQRDGGRLDGAHDGARPQRPDHEPVPVGAGHGPDQQRRRRSATLVSKLDRARQARDAVARDARLPNFW